MKRVLALVFLPAFFSLQTYQLCDESHDAYAALSHKARLVFQKSVGYASPAAVDDPDASLPLVVGQTLGHGSEILSGWPLVYPSAHHLPGFAAAFISQTPAQDRSPPSDRPVRSAPPSVSLLACLPARSLAPPLS